MPFQKGHKLSGSRKDKPNKTTQEIKNIYTKLVQTEQSHWPKVLKDIREKDPYQYMLIMDKIASKVVANKKDITSDDKQIESTIIIKEERSND